MHFNEHPPPHFHIVAGDDAAVLRIDTLELWEGEIRARDAQEALAWAAGNRAELYSRWAEYCEEE